MNNLKAFFDALSNIAAGRNYISFIAGIITPLMLLGVVDDAQRAELLAALNQFGDALEALFGASKRVFAAVTPVVAVVMALFAGKKSTIEVLLGLLKKSNETAAPKDQVSVLASPEIIEKVGQSPTMIPKDQAVIVASPAIANANPSPNVMSSDEFKVVSVDKAPSAPAIQPQ